MSHKRKAELQRKLSMAPVAKPPEGLAERIKQDIPQSLGTRAGGERLSPPFAFTLRVAASVILLIGSVYLTIQLLSRDEQSRMVIEPMGAREQQFAATADAPPATAPAAEPEKVEQAVVENPAVLAGTPPPRPQRERRAEPAVQSARADAQAPPPAAPAPAFAHDAAAAPRAEIASVAAGAPPPPPPPQPAEERDIADARLDAPRPSPVTTAPAARTMSRAEPVTVTSLAQKQGEARPAPFGISVDPAAFLRVKELIERGERPAADAVDVSAIIQHFAGPGGAAQGTVDVQVEASRAPAEPAGRSVIRYTIDSGIATMAELSVRLEPAAVLEQRVVSPGAALGSSRGLLAPRQSVTGLIELSVAPSARDDDPVATVTLRYRSSSGPETLTRVVRVADLRRSWSSASRRHRLATLGAAWSESLLSDEASGDIDRAAQALAEEIPGDERARDLAAAASAFARLRSSGPTGSAD